MFCLGLIVVMILVVALETSAFGVCGLRVPIFGFWVFVDSGGWLMWLPWVWCGVLLLRLCWFGFMVVISVNSVVFKFSFVYVLFSFNCRLCLAVCVAWVWDTRLLAWWWVCDSGYFYVFDALLARLLFGYYC